MKAHPLWREGHWKAKKPPLQTLAFWKRQQTMNFMGFTWVISHVPMFHITQPLGI